MSEEQDALSERITQLLKASEQRQVDEETARKIKAATERERQSRWMEVVSCVVAPRLEAVSKLPAFEAAEHLEVSASSTDTSAEIVFRIPRASGPARQRRLLFQMEEDTGMVLIGIPIETSSQTRQDRKVPVEKFGIKNLESVLAEVIDHVLGPRGERPWP